MNRVGKISEINKASGVSKWNFWCPEELVIREKSVKKVAHKEGCTPRYEYRGGEQVPENLVDEALEQWLAESDEIVQSTAHLRNDLGDNAGW